MTRLATSLPELLELNRGSLQDPRVTIVHDDGFTFLEHTRRFFDVIVCDLPDPNTETLAKLYSRAFYALCARHLSARGVVVTQATSPFFATKAFWCIYETMRQAVDPVEGVANGLEPVAYHVNVPSFGEWGFVLAAHHAIDPSTLAPSVPTRFLTAEVLPTLFVFGKDLLSRTPPRPNRLDDPVLYRYYRDGWHRFNG